MLKVGLTGNIASGKSSVVRIWQQMGGEVVDADVLARRVVEPGMPTLRRIQEEWGDGVLAPDGSLDRARMREIAFADPVARRRLEAITHPEIARLREEAYAEAERAGAGLVIADIPLLFEVGLDSEFDVVVLVDAPEQIRLGRLVQDRGLPPDQGQRMIDAQLPAADKRPRADLVIENDGTLEELEQRARDAWEELLRRGGEGTPGG